jgi:predicted negative regulator of RcsB-dependent stress response
MAYVAGVVAAAVLGYWFYTRSVEIKHQNAERALNTALQSVQAGNAALAQSDLQKVVDRYSDTEAGIEAGMVLAQMKFDGGNVKDGVALLDKLAGSRAAGPSRTAIYSLIGDGQLQAAHAADAAKAYERAADATPFDHEKAWQLGKAARALTIAGDVPGARKIWEQLATDPKATGLSSEAKVRLGELEAKPAGKS